MKTEEFLNELNTIITNEYYCKNWTTQVIHDEFSGQLIFIFPGKIFYSHIVTILEAIYENKTPIEYLNKIKKENKII